jgi:AraC-like DNA-binding protein
MSLARFLGSELVTALGGLDSPRVLGPWRGRRPAERRRRAKFVPVLYGEDHAHDHAELCLLLAGRCHFSFGHAGGVLVPGDLVVCPAGQPHAESWRRRGESYRLAWWNLHEREPTLHVTHYAQRGGFSLVHQLSLAALPAEARGRLDTLRGLAAAKTAPVVESLREALLTLTLALYRCALESGEAQLDTRAQLVRRAAEFVRAEAHRPLALAAVARAVHVSPNYLTGLFRATTGVPLGRFVLEERIALAQRRLSGAGATVKTVALELGFSDPFSFSRAFKRVTGRAPSQWVARG